MRAIMPMLRRLLLEALRREYARVVVKILVVGIIIKIRRTRRKRDRTREGNNTRKRAIVEPRKGPRKKEP